MRDVLAIQASVQELAARTASLRADCRELVAELNRDHLPRGPEYDRMGEDDVAPSMAYYFAGVLGVVESDNLRKVEKDLVEAAQITAAEMARDFEPEGPEVSRRPLPPAVNELADEAFLRRLLLGAQTEHEQRLTAVRLLRRDERFRAEVAAVLAPFEALDADLAAEYGQALREADVAARHREILERAFVRAPDLDHILRHLTYGDILGQAKVTRRIFSWSMAERLLERARRPGQSSSEVKASLYLALMVIDAVEILSAAGHTPDLPEVVADVRRRISETALEMGDAPGKPSHRVAQA